MDTTRGISENDKGTATIIDNETGEVIGELKPGDRIVHKKEGDGYIYDFNKGASFVKLYDDVAEDLAKYLTPAEFIYAIRLSKHVSYEDNILRLNGHGNGRILTVNDISELVGDSYKNTNKIINRLVSKGVLGKHETGCKEDPKHKIKCITCNPYVYVRGSKLNSTIISLFSDTRWATTDKKQ